jgi:hypothetical protein
MSRFESRIRSPATRLFFMLNAAKVP